MLKSLHWRPFYFNFLGSRPARARSTLHGRGPPCHGRAPPCHWRGPPCTGALHPATGALHPARARSTLHGRAPPCPGAPHPASYGHSCLHGRTPPHFGRTPSALRPARAHSTAHWAHSERILGTPRREPHPARAYCTALRAHSGAHGRIPPHSGRTRLHGCTQNMYKTYTNAQ